MYLKVQRAALPPQRAGGFEPIRYGVRPPFAVLTYQNSPRASLFREVETATEFLVLRDVRPNTAETSLCGRRETR